MNAPGEGPELSRCLAIRRLDNRGREERISASREECDALARRFDLLALHTLNAIVTVVRNAMTGEIRISAELTARARSSCVVTLEPFDYDVQDRFELRMTTTPDTISKEVIVDPFDESDIEPLNADTLDIGEIVAQHLSLALPSHPRAPGVSLPDNATDPKDAEIDTDAVTPFAALKELKSKM